MPRRNAGRPKAPRCNSRRGLARSKLGGRHPLARANCEVQGRFKEAAELLDKALGGTDLPVARRKTFEFEVDRLERIKKCYPFSQAGLRDELRKSVAGLTDEEFEHWVKEGRFDSRQIDGQRRFMEASVGNLFCRYLELRPRRRPPKDSANCKNSYWEMCQTIKKAALEQKTPYVLPKRFRATMTVTAAAGAVPAGEIVRAWLPLPRPYPYQNGFKLVSATPAARHVDDLESPIRCVYTRRPAGRSSRPNSRSNMSSPATAFGLASIPRRSGRWDPKEPRCGSL